MARSSHGTAVAAMVVATALWGATFVVIRDSLAALPPVSIVFARFTASTIALAAIALFTRRKFDVRAGRAGILGGACAAGGGPAAADKDRARPAVLERVRRPR